MRRAFSTLRAAATILLLTSASTAQAQYGSGSGAASGLGFGGGGLGGGLGMGSGFGRGNYGGMGYGNNIFNTYGARSPSMPFNRGAVNAIQNWPYPSGMGSPTPRYYGGGNYGYGNGYNRGLTYRTGPNVPIGRIYAPASTFSSAYGGGSSRGFYANYMDRSFMTRRRVTITPTVRVFRPYRYDRPAIGRYYHAR